MLLRIFNAFTLVGIAIFYFPKLHTRAEGISRLEILKKIDYSGGVASIIGLTLL